MSREVKLKLPLPANTSITVTLCNKYGVSVLGEQVELTLDNKSEVENSLRVNTDGTCWKVDKLIGNSIFWVYEGEGVQLIDMTEMIYPHALIDAFLSSEDNTLGLNAQSVIDRHYREEILVCEEEKRFICRFYDWIEKQQDTKMCRINEKLIERYNNGY